MSRSTSISAVQFAADNAFRLCPPNEGILHLEPQSSWDGDLPDRMLVYNARLHDKYGSPVYTVVLLLRPEANASSVLGTVSRRYPDGREYHRFEYTVIRVWELPAEPFLNGPWGTLPLAMLSDEAKDRLPEFVTRIDNRLRDEHAAEDTRKLLLTCCYLLLGMRYNDDDIRRAFAGANQMKESSTYQAILREGVVQGRQEDVLRVLRERFGNCPPEVERKVRNSQDANRLQDALMQAIRVVTPSEIDI